MGTNKQSRKYNLTKEEEITPDPKPVIRKFKILIDGANFLKEQYDSYAEADAAAIEFCKGSRCKYDIV